MEKRSKFSENPKLVKIVYAAVIAILCITAIVIGIVSASNKSQDGVPDNTPPVSDGDGTVNEDGNKPNEEQKEPKPLAFVSPVVGTVAQGHSLTEPVFSLTLGEWRVHTGIDISCDEDSAVYAAESGTVTGVYNDAKLGHTVEITHRDGMVTRYSNLDAASTSELVTGASIAAGDRIGIVGDSATYELADEAHLHFEMLKDGVKVDPMDYITEESKKASLGITEQ